MKTRRFFLILFSVWISMLLFQCAVPRYFWSEDDMQSEETGIPSSEKKLLIASPYTDFKQAVVKKIKLSLSNDSIYVKTIGLSQLDAEKCADYSAVLVINTCIAWGMERKVTAFLKQQKNHGNIIVLITSGDGKWLPNKKGREFDAVASASETDQSETIAEKTLSKIHLFL